MSPSLPIPNASFRLASGEWLDVRVFHVTEEIGSPFTVELTTVHPDPDLDLEGFVGEPGRFELAGGRSWVGAVRAFELVQAEAEGLSTYKVVLVPMLWLLTQRTNHRIFQRMTEPAMATLLLDEWGVDYELSIDAEAYKKRDYRVQYGESDFAFMSRMLEDAGITYWFETRGDSTVMVLSDSPQTGDLRAPLPHVPEVGEAQLGQVVTKLSVARELRPGKYSVRDVDFRIPPNYPLLASTAASQAKPVENDLESFEYTPGAFLFEGEGGGSPAADDKLSVRSSEREGERLAMRRLEAARSEAKHYRFQTNALDVKPGLRMVVTDHSRSDLGVDQPLLVTQTVLHGDVGGEWSMRCRAARGDIPFRSPVSTPKPKVAGVETATVVGASGDEIHTDEFGRIRVHFHWDRDSKMNDESSCWVPVSHPWAGTGFGGMNIPRVGQEVVIDFLGGDPDKPVVMGRLYTALQSVPFKLPENKTQSGWKSNSTTGSGGYNEIMFEDDVGREQVRIQAERNMDTLVKHDQTLTVENDRTKKVLNDEISDIGANRTETVKLDETITIGANRTETVIADESLTVQGNRSRAVHGDEDTFIGGSFSGQVVANLAQTIGANAAHIIMANRSAQIGASDSTTVAIARSASIGVSDATTVGASYSVSVAPGGAPLGAYNMTPG
ncbi:MAG: type VI secretion system tip protein VgrG, partial [Myxococcales bacterium]|nr:type VI secretion system tip protein VgrG [Myxococcales bacterium]